MKNSRTRILRKKINEKEKIKKILKAPNKEIDQNTSSQKKSILIKYVSENKNLFLKIIFKKIFKNNL